MKKSFAVLLCIAALIATTWEASAIVGYVNQAWPADGYILINNPLVAPDNRANAVLPGAEPGATLELWDPVGNTYSATSLRASWGWSINYELFPGTGALLYSPTAYTNTYVGDLVNPPPIEPPSPFSGPDGIYLLGTVDPVGVSGTNVFLWTIGREPAIGESVMTLEPGTQTLITHTYLGLEVLGQDINGQDILGGELWSNGTPSLAVAESAFFNIGNVPLDGVDFAPLLIPEPTAFTLLGLGSLALVMVRRRRTYAAVRTFRLIT